MFKANQPIILASQSPRRKELLQKLGIQFQSITSDVDENIQMNTMNEEQYVTKLAVKKAQAVANNHKDTVVIGADTIVSLNGEIFPKPKNKTEAKSFLQKLSGQTHDVITSVAIIYSGKTDTITSVTKVAFYELDDEMIEAYIHTGDCLDKAGAYGIQTDGLFFVKQIKGDYYSVMGLPVAHLTKELLRMNLIEFKKEAENL